MKQKDFFNSMAEKWDTLCYHDRDKINEILALSDIREGAKILDVGTGTGIMIPFLASRVGKNGEITAVDNAEKMLEIAKRKNDYANVRFIAGDIFNIILPEEYFDIIMCYSVFPHLEYKLTFAERLGKFLKPRGKIVVSHSQSRHEINHMHKNAAQPVSRDYLPDAETIKGYFSGCNFETIVEVDNDRMFVLIGQKNCD